VPARPDFFVGREPEINKFELYLNQTITGSPMNMSVTGTRGIGKTSLLQKFEVLAKDKGCLVLRLSNYEGNVTDIANFSDYVSSNLKIEILRHRPLEEKVEGFKDWISTFKPTFTWENISLQIEKKTVLQESFRQRLEKMWKEAESDGHRAIVLLLDEAESLERIEGVFQFIREVFQKIALDAKYMIVLFGKLNFPERLSESFSPLNRFFPASRLGNLEYNEVKMYFKRKLEGTNESISDDALHYLYDKSEGHPYVLVAMAFLTFDSLNENESCISFEVIQRSEQKIWSDLVTDFFSPMYHPISKGAKEILLNVARNTDDISFSFRQLIEWTGKRADNLSPYILELVRKGILNKPERASYQIFHGLFLEYLKHQ
jgi:AAA+ ATPase superfamily predicted ATPase